MQMARPIFSLQWTETLVIVFLALITLTITGSANAGVMKAIKLSTVNESSKTSQILFVDLLNPCHHVCAPRLVCY